MPDLSGLGAALQAQPDEVALRQLDGLVRFLEANWSAGELARLPEAMGTAANLDLLLEAVLGRSAESFHQAWRQQQLAEAGSPLATLVETLAELARAETAAWRRGRRAALGGYTQAGRIWRVEMPPDDALFGEPLPGEGWQISVEDTGAAGPVVWVELAADDGEQSVRDLRFYRKDAERGWLRDAPAAEFWGASRSQSGELIEWDYFAADEATVTALAPALEAAYRQAAGDFGLVAEPVTVAVAADTSIPWDISQPARTIVAASPRAYIQFAPGDDAVEALRREALARLLLELWRRKSNELPREADRAWEVLVSALVAQFELLDLPVSGLLGDDYESLVMGALAADRLPALQEIVAQYEQGSGLIGRNPMPAIYLFERHGFGWLDPALKNGLRPTLEDLLAERGWSWDDLDADWRAFLGSRQR
jgi:hypothetical protein